MNHIDRKKIGIELLFSRMSSILSRSNDLNAEDTVHLLCQQPRQIRVKLAKIINTGIKILTDDPTVDVSKYIDDNIREMAKYPVDPNCMDRLLPFFKWLMEIQRQNLLELEKSQYLLNDAISSMDRSTGSFIRTYSGLINILVSLNREENSITMYTAPQLWGRASLVFPDVETKFCGTFPMVGMLFKMDIEHINDKYLFDFLLDVEFGNKDNDKRFLQDRNWVKLSFECSCPHMELKTFDYGKILADFGKCGHDFIDAWCGEVLNKEYILGADSLSDKERKLLPAAKILKPSYQIADFETGAFSRISEEDILLPAKTAEALENPYKLALFEKLLKSERHEDLCKYLNDAAEAWSCSDVSGTSRNIINFAALLKTKEQNDSVRTLYKKISELMCDCTSEFKDKSILYGTYTEAEKKMCQIIEPNLLSLGFTGEYPHYRRRRGKKGEYITVRTINVTDHTTNGMMEYQFSISAAVKKLNTKDKISYFACEIPFEETTAEDCRNVSSKNARYAELGGSFEDTAAVINVNVFDGIQYDEKDADNAMILNNFVNLAAKSMKGKKIPRWYKKTHRYTAATFKPETTLAIAVMHYMPFGLYASVLLAAAYILFDRYFSIAEYLPQSISENAVIISLIIGVLSALICGALKMRSLKNRIWRY